MSKYKLKNRICTKCLEKIDEIRDDHVMLISKRGERIREFFIFHKKCWMEHFKEYWELRD